CMQQHRRTQMSLLMQSTRQSTNSRNQSNHLQTTTKQLDILFDATEIESDAVRQAAALALGSIPDIIPLLLTRIEKKTTFSLLNALKEALKYINANTVEDIMKRLVKIKVDEVSTNVMSECYGKLLAFDLEKYIKAFYIPALMDKNGNGALIGSIKNCMANCDPKMFIPLIPIIVSRLGDKIPAVKGALFTVISYLLIHAQKEIFPYLQTIQKQLVPQMSVDKNYVSVAKFSIVVHITDLGLEARKAVMECLSVLIDNYITELNFKNIICAIVKSIGEQNNDHDVKLLCFNLLLKMANNNSDELIENIDEIIPDLRKLISSSLDEKNKDQDTPKQQEISKAVCRFVANVASNPLAFVSSAFEKLYQDILNSLKLGAVLKTFI
ncbi:transcription enhancer protein, putative, partial [Entamoeba invadens IP1]